MHTDAAMDTECLCWGWLDLFLSIVELNYCKIHSRSMILTCIQHRGHVQGETSLPGPADMVLFSFSCWLALDLPTEWTDVEVQLKGRDGLVQRARAAGGAFSPRSEGGVIHWS